MRIEELYDRLGGKIYSYLTLKLCSTSDAEDVLQEVFCRLVRYSIRLRFVRNPASFVFRIARNEALRFLEKKARYRQGCQRVGLREIMPLVVSAPDQETLGRLAAALERIPENQREVIVLKFFEGLTFKEIASVCGLSANTAASRYRYGLDKLRLLMEEGR